MCPVMSWMFDVLNMQLEYEMCAPWRAMETCADEYTVLEHRSLALVTLRSAVHFHGIIPTLTWH